MNPLKSKIVLLDGSLLSGLVFLLTMLIAPYYTNGDQAHYTRVYDELATLDIADGFDIYISYLSSHELVHFILSWIASRCIEKDTFVALSNAVLAYLMTAVFWQLKTNRLLAAILVSSNFYLLVLYFAAERLKFGFIFMALSVIYLNNKKEFYIFCSAALFSHAQVIIVYTSIFFRFLIYKLIYAISTKRIPLYSILIILLSPLLLIPIYDQLITKFGAYFNEKGIDNLGRAIVFFILSLYYARNRLDVLALFTPIVVAAFLVGGERVNLFAYFIFLYYGLRFRSGINVGVIATTVYYSYASIPFVMKILEYGDGFY